MRRILILGGTRFVGKHVASQLALRHNVTVLSRNPLEIPGTHRIVQERVAGLTQLSGKHFDTVLDFIAYDHTSVPEACALADTYLAISSAWLPRLNGSTANAAVPADDSTAPANMLAVTKRYLLGKAHLEEAIFACRAQGQAAAALRLPILMGAEDHTGRLEFYRRRIADGKSLLLVNGGANSAQLLWSQDAARLIVSLIESKQGSERAIWEALPDDGIRVVDFVTQVARNMNMTCKFASISADKLMETLPAYLEVEPLWRESSLTRTEANLFAKLNLAPTPHTEWLSRIPRINHDGVDLTRPAEIELAGKMMTCSAH